MNRRRLKEVERKLVRGAVGEFTEAELDGLPDPVRRFFRAAVAPGTPLARSARIRMRGRIKIGRWLPFRAREVLTPHRGFIWAARAAGLISGSDHYARGQGEMDWRLAGLIRVMHAAGPDVSRSGAERAAAEAVWLPTALLPRFGVEWAATDDTSINCRYLIDEMPIHVHCRLGGDGRIRSVVFNRWGDPDDTGTWASHRFGGEFTSHATFDGVTVPDRGRLGWHYGTDRWGDGEFFRYRMTDMEPVQNTAS